MGTRTMGTRTIGTRTFGTRSFGNRTIGTRTIGTRTIGTRTIGTGPGGMRTFGGRTTGIRTIGAGPGGRVGIAGFGPGSRIGAGPGFGGRNFGRIHNRHVHIYRDHRRIWIGGLMRTIVPIAALTGLYVGSDYYYPDGYVTLARPYCSGVSEEGCPLRWQEVPLEGGGVDTQCVQYCRRVGIAAAPPPVPTAVVNVPAPAAPTVTGAVPPAGIAAVPPTGACELAIFSEPNFGGLSAPTSEDQPRLVDAGWKNEVASVQVKTGTWDFYADDDFAGETLRLPPGTYADLGQWTKKIGSFMCSQP